MTRIIIEVRGGIVQCVHSDNIEVSVDVLDFDELRDIKNEPGGDKYEHLLKLLKEAKLLPFAVY